VDKGSEYSFSILCKGKYLYFIASISLVFTCLLIYGCAGVQDANKYIYKDPIALKSSDVISEITWCKKQYRMSMQSITLYRCKSGFDNCLQNENEREEIFTTGWPNHAIHDCKVLLSPGEYYIEYSVYFRRTGFISAYGHVALQPAHTYQLRGRREWFSSKVATWIVDVSTDEIVLGSNEPERAINYWSFDYDYYQVPDRYGH